MSDLAWLLEDIDNSPEGPEIAAFFDFDGTLIDGYSAKAFFTDRLRNRDIGLRELLRTVIESAKVERRGADITRLMNTAIGGLAGRNIAEVTAAGEGMFARKIAGMVFPDVRAIIAAHAAKGHTVVIASSATPPQIAPAAKDLGITHILATEFEVDETGVLTGKIDGSIKWGKGKADAIVEFAGAHGLDLSQSYAYSNGAEDVPMLEAVGKPRPLNPDEALELIADSRGWPASRLFKPKNIGPLDVARSVASYGALGAGVVIGATSAVLNGSRRAGANLAAGVGADLALAAGGIDINVTGRENLWSSRPAVFLFNHQSQLDVLILGSLLRQDFTGVAKIEASHDPFFAPIGYLMDIAYIDRANSKQARSALGPVVDALKNGRSIAIAPEGTRSATERILPFKKGAFHIAMQAGVPLVPIVIRNAGELMRPHALFMAPGRLDVQVLEPIPTTDWTENMIDDKVTEVRQLYIDAMARWPRYQPPVDEYQM